MDADELLIVQESQAFKNETTRAVRSADVASMFVQSDITDTTASSQYGGKGGKPMAMDSMPSMRQHELSLMHVNLKSDKSVGDMWSSISNVVQNLPDVDPMFDETLKRLIGNKYQAGNYCEFLVGLYEVQERPVLDFKRLCGDGFVMDSFFTSVKENCKKVGIVDEEDEETEDGDDDVFDCYSSDDDSDEESPEDEKYLRPNGFLQLSYDENLVKTWIEKIKTRHIEDKNHMMGLMAHNATLEANLKIIMNKGGKELIKLCQHLLESSSSAALVRNTSALVKELANVSSDWDVDCITAMLEAMTFWVPNNGRKDEENAKTFEVTESRETVNNLVESIFIMNKNGIPEADIAEKVEAHAEGQSTEVSRLVSYIESQNQTEASTFVLGLFPQNL